MPNRRGGLGGRGRGRGRAAGTKTSQQHARCVAGKQAEVSMTPPRSGRLQITQALRRSTASQRKSLIAAIEGPVYNYAPTGGPGQRLARLRSLYQRVRGSKR